MFDYIPLLQHRGLNKQGYKCRRESFINCYLDFYHIYYAFELIVNKIFGLLFHPECNAAIHKKCIEIIIGRCTGTAANSRDTVVSKVNLLKHQCKTSPQM